MLGRLLPTSVIRGHWKGLSFYRDDQIRPDYASRMVVVAVPIVAAGLMVFFNGRLQAPASILAGLALLAGGLLAAFGQLSALRLRLTERMISEDDGQRTDRDYLDETAAHLLMAAYGAAFTAAVIVIGMNFALDKHGALTGWWAAIAAGLSAWVVTIFLMALPRLYDAYVGINKVRDQLSGTHSGK